MHKPLFGRSSVPMLRHDVHEYQVHLALCVECGSVTPRTARNRAMAHQPEVVFPSLECTLSACTRHFEVVKHVGRFRQHPLNDLMTQQKVARPHGAFVFVCIPLWDLCVAALGQLGDNVAVAIATMAPSMSNLGDFSDQNIC